MDVVGVSESQWGKRVGLMLGPVLFALILAMEPFDVPTKRNEVIASFAWMLVWWITETVPLAVTALLPIVLFTLTGVMTLDEVVVPYSNRVVFLFMGGFFLALALEEHNVHKRIALRIISATGVSPPRLILGFMLATAALSMWISNTATAVMMLPMALSVLKMMHSEPAVETASASPVDTRLQKRFSTALVLAIGYAASIGGMATIVGTPPNLVMCGHLKKIGIEISFLQWMSWAVPIVVVLLALTYCLLVFVLFPIRGMQIGHAADVITAERKKLGRRTSAQTRVLLVFSAAALMWSFRELIVQFFPELKPSLTDEIIALLAGISLFVIPAGPTGRDSQHRLARGQAILNWEATARLPWGILLLFGGGLCLADAFQKSGALSTVVNQFATMGQGHVFFTLGLLTLIALFATEVMSNVALVNVLVPIVIAVATGMGVAPIEFAFPVTLAASCAFMLPMATPPNAIVFSSGQITIRQMALAGFWLNLLSLAVIVLLSRILVG